MGWKGWQTFLSRAATLTCRPNVRGVARSWRRPRPGANVSQQCLTSLEEGLKGRVKKKQKQQNKTKLFVCHGSTLDLKIKNMETSKQEILCKCCRAKVCSCSPPCQPATSPLEKQKRRRVRCCSKARLPGGPPETGKANSASGKVEIMENVEMKVSSAIFSPHDSKIAPF